MIHPGPAVGSDAGSAACLDLVHPLDKKFRVIKDRGGIWSLFERARGLSDHSPLALQIDSKVMSLMFTLEYLCATEQGIPYNDLALYLDARIQEKGGEDPVRKELLNMGYSVEEVTILLEYINFSRKNKHRKLDFNQIRKTVGDAQVYVERYWLLGQKMKKRSPASLVEEVKALVKDIEKFRATDPYFQQADRENAQVPHSTLSENSDQM